MRSLLLTVFVALLQQRSVLGATGEYSYDGEEDGKLKWAEKFPEYCSGTVQSPINIETKKTILANIPEVYCEFYETRSEYLLKNVEKTVLMTRLNTTHVPYLTNGDLPGKFNLLQMHWHWGTDSSSGAENTIDGKHYPLEMHFVHINDKYSTAEDALANKDGLAVTGVLFVICDEDNTALDPFFNALANITEAGSETTITLDSLYPFIPPSYNNFYRFNGSLTTPTCNEVVTWTVIDEVLCVSEAQMEKLRAVKNAKGESISGNWRNVQDINGRRILRSFNTRNKNKSVFYDVLETNSNISPYPTRYSELPN